MKEQIGATSKQPSAAIQGTLIACSFMTYMVVIAIGCMVAMYATRDKERFFIDPPQGTPVEIFPIDQPNVTSSSLINWVTQAVTSAHTIDFFHYQDNIDSMKEYFTAPGYADFTQGLSETLKRITTEKLIVSAVATDTAVILQEGIMNGIYSWRIQVPLLITYQGASTNSTKQKVASSILVTRVATNIAPKGIGIAQLIDSEMND
jgi:intracellular multiplication protein IcmL